MFCSLRNVSYVYLALNYILKITRSPILVVFTYLCPRRFFRICILKVILDVLLGNIVVHYDSTELAPY